MGPVARSAMAVRTARSMRAQNSKHSPPKPPKTTKDGHANNTRDVRKARDGVASVIEQVYDSGMSLVDTERAQRVLEDRLADVCGQLNVHHAALVTIAAEALETGGWQGGGIHSPAHWLAWKTGLSPQRAAQIVGIAKRRDGLPVTLAAFADGLLAIDQVAVGRQTCSRPVRRPGL